MIQFSFSDFQCYTLRRTKDSNTESNTKMSLKDRNTDKKYFIEIPQNKTRIIEREKVITINKWLEGNEAWKRLEWALWMLKILISLRDCLVTTDSKVVFQRSQDDMKRKEWHDVFTFKKKKTHIKIIVALTRYLVHLNIVLGFLKMKYINR